MSVVTKGLDHPWALAFVPGGDMLVTERAGRLRVIRKGVLEKLDEFKLSKGRLPLVGNGSPLGTPELKNIIGADLLEGLLFSVADWPFKGDEEMVERFKKRMGIGGEEGAVVEGGGVVVVMRASPWANRQRCGACAWIRGRYG